MIIAINLVCTVLDVAGKISSCTLFLITLVSGAGLRNSAVNSELSPVLSGTVPGVYDPRRTVLVRTAKTWDSPHAGTVPVLLE